jgi:GNAT superfamily N-acetyltransferase
MRDKLSADKLRAYWKRYGTLILTKKIILRIISPLFSYTPLNFYGISGLPLTQIHPRCPLEIRKGGPEDIDLIVESSVYTDYIDGASVPERIKYLLNTGEMFLAFSEGRLVHVAWLHYGPGVREVFPHVKIMADDAFIGRCQTHPEFRGKNIYPAVLQHMVRYAVAKNKKRCFISTSPTITASIKGIEKAGFFFVGKLRRFRLFGKIFNNRWMSPPMEKQD